MNRGWILAAIVALLATFALWFAATVEKSPLTRSFGARKVPRVVAGRDSREDQRQVVRDEDAAMIRCQFDGEGSPGTLLAMGEGQALTSGTDLSLGVPTGSWTVYWQSEKRGTVELGRVEPEPGAVETCRLTDAGWRVTGRVANPDGEPLAGTSVFVCGSRVRTSEDGRFVGAARTAPCNVRAVYEDGILTRRSDPITVNAFLARDVDFVVDDAPIAGMGIGFRMAVRGARVNLVHPGTPAEEAGVRVGDVITSIDGEPTPGLTDDAFITLGTGREGSLVTLEVERDGEPLTFTFRRERLDAVDTG